MLGAEIADTGLKTADLGPGTLDLRGARREDNSFQGMIQYSLILPAETSLSAASLAARRDS